MWKCWLHRSTHPCCSSTLQVTRGLFGSSKGSFTSFFTRTGYGGSPGQGMEASIHGGANGGFRQVRSVVWDCKRRRAAAEGMWPNA